MSLHGLSWGLARVVHLLSYGKNNNDSSGALLNTIFPHLDLIFQRGQRSLILN